MICPRALRTHRDLGQLALASPSASVIEVAFGVGCGVGSRSSLGMWRWILVGGTPPCLSDGLRENAKSPSHGEDTGLTASCREGEARARLGCDPRRPRRGETLRRLGLLALPIRRAGRGTHPAHFERFRANPHAAADPEPSARRRRRSASVISATCSGSGSRRSHGISRCFAKSGSSRCGPRASGSSMRLAKPETALQRTLLRCVGSCLGEVEELAEDRRRLAAMRDQLRCRTEDVARPRNRIAHRRSRRGRPWRKPARRTSVVPVYRELGAQHPGRGHPESDRRGVSAPTARAAIPGVGSTRWPSSCSIRARLRHGWVSLQELGRVREPGAPALDFVFTVCDDAADETCPVWLGRPVTAHWGVEDPAAVAGPETERAGPSVAPRRAASDGSICCTNLDARRSIA